MAGARNKSLAAWEDQRSVPDPWLRHGFSVAPEATFPFWE